MSFGSAKNQDVPGQTGFPGFTTPLQDEAVTDLRSEISPLLSSAGGQYLIKMMGGEEYFFCRMLRARKWDVKAAAQLVSEILEYRAEHNIDSILHRVLGEQRPQDPLNPTWRPKILDETIAKVMPLLPCGRHGYTKTGQTLEIWRINQLRPADILAKCSREELIAWWHYWAESGLQSSLDGSAHTKQPLRGTVLVLDLQGFGTRHLNTAVLRSLTHLFGIGQSKFPESLSRVFVLNSPRLFSGVWAVIKPVLDERTRNKITISSRPAHPDLAALVPAAAMPVFLGGESECRIGEEASGDSVAMTTVTVAARGELRVPVVVETAGSYVGWEFRTDGNKDIKFGVFFFGPGAYNDSVDVTKGEAVVAVSKAGSSQGSVQDMLEGCRAGTYVLLFDNSYSMMTGKTLRYAVDCGVPLEGGEQEEECMTPHSASFRL